MRRWAAGGWPVALASLTSADTAGRRQPGSGRGITHVGARWKRSHQARGRKVEEAQAQAVPCLLPAAPPAARPARPHTRPPHACPPEQRTRRASPRPSRTQPGRTTPRRRAARPPAKCVCRLSSQPSPRTKKSLSSS